MRNILYSRPVVFLLTICAFALLLRYGANAAQPPNLDQPTSSPILIATNRVIVPKTAKVVLTNLDLSTSNAFVVVTNVAFTKPPEKLNEGLNWPRIRHDWTDVLLGEDPSQPGDNKLPATYADIKGATFSYANNQKNSSDTWSANGAIIAPYIHYYDLAFNHFTMLAAAPSITLNKVSDNAHPTNNIDDLEFRFGVYSKFLGARHGDFEYALLLRAAFVYETDTEFRASLPAGQIQLEPDLLWSLDNGGPFCPDWTSIGYQNILYGHRDNKKEDDVIDYRLRGWLALEGGDLQQNGAAWHTVNGSFFRLGPTVQLQINFNNILNGLSLQGEYGYQFDVSGPTGNNSLYSLSAALNLYKNDSRHDKVALTVSYTRGGLTLSKQSVDLLSVGVGAIF